MLPVAAALVAALSSASASLPYSDIRTTDASGNEIIIRSSTFPDPSGGSDVVVEQRLRPLGNGRFEIDAKDQSRATQLYHLALCEAKGMKPDQGVGRLSGDMAIGGFTCHSHTYQETIEAPAHAMAMPAHAAAATKSAEPPILLYDTDYVNGSSPVGAPFVAKSGILISGQEPYTYTYGLSIKGLGCEWEGSGARNDPPFFTKFDYNVSCMGSDSVGVFKTESVVGVSIRNARAIASGKWSIVERDAKASAQE